MADVKNFLIVVNSGVDHPYNHYAAYVVAFLGKKLGNIENVTIYYGPLGINIVSCGTFHVIDGVGKDLDDLSNVEDFIVPVKLPQAAEALLGADKIHYL